MGWDQGVRERIQTSMLLNRLSDHVFGKCELSNTQVRAAEILLSKTLPSLSSIEHSGDVTTTNIARLPAAIKDTDTWQKQHAPQEEPPPTLQ